MPALSRVSDACRGHGGTQSDRTGGDSRSSVPARTTAGAPSPGGESATDAPEGASQSVAPAGTAASSGPAVPAPLPTVGAADPDTAPAVHHLPKLHPDDPGWAAALSARRAHYVPAGTPREWHHGRPTGLGLDGWPGLIDKRGLADGERLPKCRACVRQGAPLPAPGEPC